MTLTHSNGRPIKDVRDRAQLTKLYNKILRDYDLEPEHCRDCIFQVRMLQRAIMETYQLILTRQQKDRDIVRAKPLSS